MIAVATEPGRARVRVQAAHFVNMPLWRYDPLTGWTLEHAGPIDLSEGSGVPGYLYLKGEGLFYAWRARDDAYARFSMLHRAPDGTFQRSDWHRIGFEEQLPIFDLLLSNTGAEGYSDDRGGSWWYHTGQTLPVARVAQPSGELRVGEGHSSFSHLWVKNDCRLWQYVTSGWDLEAAGEIETARRNRPIFEWRWTITNQWTDPPQGEWRWFVWGDERCETASAMHVVGAAIPGFVVWIKWANPPSGAICGDEDGWMPVAYVPLRALGEPIARAWLAAGATWASIDPYGTRPYTCSLDNVV